MKLMLGLFAIVFLLGAMMIVGCKTSRSGYESASYTVIRSAGQFETRDYAALTVVETPMSSANNSADGSFNRLFRFISGQNQTKQKIAMTTPVFMSGTATNRMMAFVMPQKMKSAEVPSPSDTMVSVRTLSPQRFAVFRFNGGRSPENESAALVRLQEWLTTQSLPTNGTPIFAYYDPPWTPGLLRRNEVLLPIPPAP